MPGIKILWYWEPEERERVILQMKSATTSGVIIISIDAKEGIRIGIRDAVARWLIGVTAQRARGKWLNRHAAKIVMKIVGSQSKSPDLAALGLSHWPCLALQQVKKEREGSEYLTSPSAFLCASPRFVTPKEQSRGGGGVLFPSQERQEASTMSDSSTTEFFAACDSRAPLLPEVWKYVIFWPTLYSLDGANSPSTRPRRRESTWMENVKCQNIWHKVSLKICEFWRGS